MATTKATNLGHRSDVTLKGTTTTIETDVVVSDTTTINNAGDDVGLKINSTSTGHIMQLQDSGTDVMVVANGGNVGIGTSSSPSTPIEVVNTSFSSSVTGGKLRHGTTFQIQDSGSNLAQIVAYSEIDKAVQIGLQRNKTSGSYNDAWTIGMPEDSRDLRISKDTLGTALTVDTSGNVGIGTTSPGEELEIYKSSGPAIRLNQNGDYKSLIKLAGNDLEIKGSNGMLKMYTGNADGASSTKRFFINANGIFGFNAQNDTTTAGDNSGTTGLNIQSTGRLDICTNSAGMIVNRISDGTLISLRRLGTTEGDISVSGSTVSYNGGHLSRWSYLPSKQKDESFLKGTVLTNLDAMCEWEKETGEKKNNEQLNQVNISTEEGDPNVAGVFVNWGDFDEAQYTNTHDLNMAMTGDMIIRIANGVTVEKGQLLMSAGDGTAKPQGNDIVKNKTIAKVTSNHVTCTYDDGSYCVPCVLMAC